MRNFAAFESSAKCRFSTNYDGTTNYRDSAPWNLLWRLSHERPSDWSTRTTTITRLPYWACALDLQGENFRSARAQYFKLLLVVVHSRPQRPRSFWSAPRIATKRSAASGDENGCRPRTTIWRSLMQGEALRTSLEFHLWNWFLSSVCDNKSSQTSFQSRFNLFFKAIFFWDRSISDLRIQG